jgi:hypothetical protein
MQLTLFEALLIVHLLMDWVFQHSWQAVNKTKKFWPLLSHCFIYTLAFTPVFIFYRVNFEWLALIFVTHALLDSRKWERLIMEKLKGMNKQAIPAYSWNLVLIMIDQSFHLLVLALVSFFS